MMDIKLARLLRIKSNLHARLCDIENESPTSTEALDEYARVYTEYIETCKKIENYKTKGDTL